MCNLFARALVYSMGELKKFASKGEGGSI